MTDQAGACPSCGHPLRPQADFCGKCGASIPQEATAARSATEVSTAPSATAESSSGTTRKPGRWTIVAIASAAGAVIAAGAIGVFVLLGGSGDAAATPPVATSTTAAAAESSDEADQFSDAAAPLTEAPYEDEEPEEPILVPGSANLTSAFMDRDPDYDPGDLCFGPGANNLGVTYLVLGGVRYEQNFVQCGSRAGGVTANGYYRFDRRALGLRPGSYLNGVTGDFVVDETSRDRSAVVRWTVRYGDEVVCRASARWGSSGTCDMQGRSVSVDRLAPLTIEQEVVSSGTGSVWAGIHHPTLHFDVPQ